MPESAPGVAARLSLSGEMTVFTAQEIQKRLLDAIAVPTADEIDVDLADVAEIDSAGLQLMVMAKREAAAAGKTLRFSRHSASVLAILDLSDLSGFFGDPVVIRSPTATPARRPA